RGVQAHGDEPLRPQRLALAGDLAGRRELLDDLLVGELHPSHLLLLLAADELLDRLGGEEDAPPEAGRREPGCALPLPGRAEAAGLLTFSLSREVWLPSGKRELRAGRRCASHQRSGASLRLGQYWEGARCRGGRNPSGFLASGRSRRRGGGW